MCNSGLRSFCWYVFLRGERCNVPSNYFMSPSLHCQGCSLACECCDTKVNVCALAQQIYSHLTFNENNSESKLSTCLHDFVNCFHMVFKIIQNTFCSSWLFSQFYSFIKFPERTAGEPAFLYS